MATCEKCGGRGYTTWTPAFDDREFNESCLKCNGSGYVNVDPLSASNAEKNEVIKQNHEKNVKAGIEESVRINGSKIHGK